MSESATDLELLTDFRAGNAAAFREFYGRYKAGLFGFILAMVDDSDIAEDVLQELFISVCKNSASFTKARDIRHYLFRSAHNLAMNELRRLSRERRAVKAKRSLCLQPKAGQAQTLPEEEAGRLAKALQGLEAEERSVVLLHEYENLSFPEMTELLDIPQTTLYRRYEAGMKRLKTILNL